MKLFRILLLCVVLIMFLILTYQSGTTLKVTVDRIADFILSVFQPGLGQGTQEYYRAQDCVQFFLRKAAHFLFFFTITFLLLRITRSPWLILAIALVAAFGTELAKNVIGEGRHSELVDMLLNAAGVITAETVNRIFTDS